MIDFLETNKLLYKNQSGFRQSHSCQTALTKIIDNWLNALNESETVGALFLDRCNDFPKRTETDRSGPKRTYENTETDFYG